MFVGSLVGWLVGDGLLLRDLGPYGIMFVAMCVYYFRFLLIIDGSLSFEAEARLHICL
jgi:hypothetical protein